MVKPGFFKDTISKVESSKRKLVVLVRTGANGAFQKGLRRSYSDMTYTYKRRVIREYHANSLGTDYKVKRFRLH